MIKPTSLAALLVVASAAAPLGAQLPATSASPRPRAEVMILGTYHMANPGLDMNNVTADDVRTPARQRELAVLATALGTFKPTRIAVEVPSTHDAGLHAWYMRYRANPSADTSRNETAQVAMRLAHALGHERLYAIDYKGDLDVGSVFGWAMQNGQGAVVQAAQAEVGAMMAKAQTQMATLSIPGILREANLPKTDSLHAMYLKLAQIGRDTTYIGARVAADWYTRNLHIYANIARVAQPGERVLVLIGAGHTPTLREFVRWAREWTLVDPLPYLGTAEQALARR